MTLKIANLLEALRALESAANNDERPEWTDIIEALKTYEDYPLGVLTAKLKQVALKKPVAKAAKKPSGAGAAPRARKPKLAPEQLAAIIEGHVRKLKEAFDDDGAFGATFETMKSDATLDAKAWLKLFEGVIGPVNFSAEPLRKPTVQKQLRDQRNTIVYRAARTGQSHAAE